MEQQPKVITGPHLANPNERACRYFLGLAEEFVSEGNPGMLWGPDTRLFYENLFWDYAGSTGIGAVAVDINGFCLAGGPLPYNTPWGKTAAGWGTYVRQGFRRQGLSQELRRIVIDRLRELGFKAIVGQVGWLNDSARASLEAIGWEPLGQSGVHLID